MLFVLIAACLAVVIFAVALCRVAGRTDEDDAAALAERKAMDYIAERNAAHRAEPGGEPVAELRPELQRGSYRASGSS